MDKVLLLDKVRSGRGEVTLRATDIRAATTHLAVLIYDIVITIKPGTTGTIKPGTTGTVTIRGDVKAEAPTDPSHLGYGISLQNLFECKSVYNVDLHGNLQIPVDCGVWGGGEHMAWVLDEGNEVQERYASLGLGSQFNGNLTIMANSKNTGRFVFQPPGGSGTVTRNLKIMQ